MEQEVLLVWSRIDEEEHMFDNYTESLLILRWQNLRDVQGANTNLKPLK